MKTLALIIGILDSLTLVSAQGRPNTVHALYPDLVTMVAEGIFIVVPISSDIAKKIAGNYNLIQAPGFAPGTSPLLVVSTFNNDIRQGSLYIESLKGTQLIVPYIDRLSDGKTPFSKTAEGFIGGTNGSNFGGVIPSLFGRIASDGGYPLYPGIMDPDYEPYYSIPPSEYVEPDQFYSNTKFAYIVNPAGGPGVTPQAVNILFQSGVGYSAEFIEEVLNQPAILLSGMCQRNQYRFNETFASVTQRTGDADIYDAVSLNGILNRPVPGKSYQGSGITGAAEFIMFNPEDCATAAANSRVY